jgi:hypothetical protein
VHLDEEQVQRLLDGELTQEAERAVREHAASCEACRQKLADAERDLRHAQRVLPALDDPPPAVTAEAVTIWAEVMGAGERMQKVALLRRAAAVVLVVGIAGAAYAIPGSPVRGWVHAVVQRLGGHPGSSPRVAPPPEESIPVGAGISVPPGDKLQILFVLAQGEGQAFVSLTDGPEVQVHAPTGAASFTSGSGQLLVDVRDPSPTFEVQIPRAAPWVEIQSGGIRVFLKDGERVSGASSSPGGYILKLRALNP